MIFYTDSGDIKFYLNRHPKVGSNTKYVCLVKLLSYPLFRDLFYVFFLHPPIVKVS